MRVAHEHLVFGETGGDALALDHLGGVNGVRPRGWVGTDDSLGERVARLPLHAHEQVLCQLAVTVVVDRPNDPWVAVRERPRLVEQDRVHLPELGHHVAALEQDAMARAVADARHV
jgi:hypothetical protein